MTIHYQFLVEEDVLLVEAWGFDDNLTDVLQYSSAVVAACQQGNFTKVLCNEVRLEYRLGTLDTYEVAKSLAEQVPSLARAAIVCRETALSDARFWETVAVNRGMHVRAFVELAAARRWLAQE